MEITTPDGIINAYLAVPPNAGDPTARWPGVVVVQDALGLSADLKRICHNFAAEGFLALAPDLYSRGGRRKCIKTVFQQALSGSGRAYDDIEAARQVLLARSDCTGKVGIAGFCLGGGFALVAASRGFDASAPYYGRLPKDPAVFEGACPIVASFGGKDWSLRGAAAKLEAQLSEKGVTHDVKEYPDAGHSFANQLEGTFGKVARVAGFGFHQEANDDAWARVMTYFRTYLA